VTWQELQMKRGIVLAAVLAVVLVGTGLAAPVPFKRGKALTPLEKKMVGIWKGQGGCDGNFLFRADGTYEWTGYGPDNSESAGTWTVRGDSLPARLLLTCKTSVIPEEVGKTTEMKLTVLDQKNLAIDYGSQNGSPSGKYARAKK
jgi:hypothetical protein